MFRVVFLGMASLACALSSTSHAEIDRGCVQKLLKICASRKKVVSSGGLRPMLRQPA